jgi:hypothetical protein
MPADSRAFVLLLAGCICAQDKPEKPVDITCRVVDSIHYSGISEVEVTLRTASGESESGTTGSTGYVTLHQPLPGPWLATASHDDFVPIRGDAFYPFEGAQLIRAAKDDEPPRCNLTLKPKSSLAGVILDRDNAPVKNVTVTALWRTFQSGESSYMFAAETRSANDGSFLLPKLLPGVYVLRAEPSHGAKDKAKFRTTYFASAEDVQSSSPIRLPAGTNITGYRFRLENAAAVDLTLRISSTTGIAPDQEVTVMRGTNDFSRVSYSEECCSTQKLADGRLLLRNVPAGTYTFLVSAVVEGVKQEGRATLSIGDQPAAIADIVVAPLQTINAKLMRKNRKPPLTFILLYLRDMTIGVHAAQADGSDMVRFEDVAPGMYRLTVAGLSDSEYLEAFVDGEPVAAGAIEIPAGPVALEFHVSRDGGSLEVDADPDTSCVDTSLLVFREGVAQAVTSARAAKYGCKFEAKGLQAGEYSIALARHLEQGEASDPTLRSRLKDLVTVKVEPGQHVRTTATFQTVTHEF